MEIVIPHHYRFDLTKNCLDSIPDTYKVYLVDDTIVGEAKHYCEYRKFVNWVHLKPCSLPYAINEGAKQVKGEWFLVSDNDVIIDERTWRVISETVTKAEKVGVSLCISQLKFVFWLVKTDVFRRLLYDERFAPAGGEDEDFLLRFCQAGYKWTQFDCIIYHQEGGHHSKGSIYDEGTQTEKFISKHGFRPHSDKYDKIVGSCYIHC